MVRDGADAPPHHEELVPQSYYSTALGAPVWRDKCPRQKTNFSRTFNPIAPLPPSRPKFIFLFIRKHDLIRASRLEKRGVRVVTIRECGERWPREIASVRKGADERCRADGQVVWFWHPDAGVKLATMLAHRADDGGQKARRTRESTKQP
jgi:hypothetical protein